MDRQTDGRSPRHLPVPSASAGGETGGSLRHWVGVLVQVPEQARASAAVGGGAAQLPRRARYQHCCRIMGQPRAPPAEQTHRGGSMGPSSTAGPQHQLHPTGPMLQRWQPMPDGDWHLQPGVPPGPVPTSLPQPAGYGPTGGESSTAGQRCGLALS